jgi:LacI family transcriptional regulator
MVTLKQIAETVGVSQATVSRVLNYDVSLSVSAQVRQQIIETAQALNYATPRARAGRAARPAARQRLALYHFLSLDQELADPYYVALRLGIERRAAALGYTLDKIYPDQAADPSALAALAGVIIVGKTPDETLTRIRAAARHVVVADWAPFDDSVDAVLGDLPQAMRRLLVELTGMGYARIGFVGWWDRLPGGMLTRETRSATFIDWMGAAGRYDPDLCLIDSNTEDSGYRLTQRILSRPNRPDCLIVGNDTMAVGAYRAASELGLSIPGDLAVASFNDISVAQFMAPPLSTVRLPAEEIGETSVDMLAERLGGRRITKRVWLATTTIWRQSTRQPKL